jgi:tetratricopeptide (TPR) repeat protein
LLPFGGIPPLRGDALAENDFNVEHIKQTSMQRLLSPAAWGTALSLILLLATLPAQAQNKRDEARAAVSAEDYTTAARLYDELVKESPRDKGLLVEAADVNMELERYGMARALYEHALDLDSKDPVVNRKYGAVLSELGEGSKAIEATRRALKYDESLENYMALGNAYIKSGKDSLSRAEVTIISAREKFPNSPQPYVALGDLYFARGIYELSQTQYEEALQRDPSLIEPRVKLGRTYRELAKRAPDLDAANVYYNQALQEFNKVTIVAPKNARAWLEQGEIFMLAKRYEEAGQSYQTYTKLRPEDPRGDIMLARAAYEGNFYNVAIEPLQRIIAKSDSVSQAFAGQAQMMLGKSYYATKDYPKAAAAYGRVPDSSMNPEALKLYGSAILNGGGDTTKAIAVYRKLLTDNPKDCDMSLGFGNLLYKMKRYEDVIEVLTKRFADCPDAPKTTPYLFIGLSEYTLKRNDRAIAAFDNAIAADSTVFQPYYWLANSYIGLKQWDKANGVIRLIEARKMADSNAKEVSQLYLLNGFDRFQAKDYAKAIEVLNKAVKLNPNNAQAYLVMAYSYQSQSDKENACKYYKATLKIDPNNADARKNMKALGCD